MSGWKYVMLRGKNQMRYPIIFPDNFVHTEVAQRFFYMDPAVQNPPVSAGFVDGLVCVDTSGESETLKLKSDPLDASLINTNPYTKGILTPLAVQTEVLLLERTMQMLQERLRVLKNNA